MSSISRSSISRRTLLIGTAGVLTAGVGTLGLVETGVLPGRAGLHQALGLTGPAGVIPDIAPGPVIDGIFVSEARLGIEVGYSVVLPPRSAQEKQSAGLPICLYLGGRGFGHRTVIDELGFDRFLAAAVAAGSKPFALVTVDGGEEYWHRRATGDDPQLMIVDELLPRVADAGHAVERLAVGGISMGGYGALLLAETLGAGRVSAVAVMSPALFPDFASAPAGAFDSAADFAQHDIASRAGSLNGIPLRVDCGADDPFAAESEKLLNNPHLHPAGGISPGLHDADYWIRLAPMQFAFVAAALT